MTAKKKMTPQERGKLGAKARLAKKDARVRAELKKTHAERSERMPTATAKQRAQKAVVALHDAGGSVTHDVPLKPNAWDNLPERDSSPNMAQLDERERREKGKLDLRAVDAPALKGVRGKINAALARPKVKAAIAAAETEKKARASKYLDHGEGHAHQFEGIAWDGTRYRTLTGKLGLEMWTPTGWVSVFNEAQYVCTTKWDLAHTLQKAAREKSKTLKPRPAVRERKPSAPRVPSDAVQSEELRTVFKRRAPAAHCEWGESQQKPTCTQIATRRVVCNSGANIVDVCAKHEPAFLNTKSARWVGCTSYALTPKGVQIDGDVRRNEVPSADVVKI